MGRYSGYYLGELNPKPISMKKNPMYYDTHRTKIFKNIYRPSSNLIRFVKSVWSVLVIGHSPISDTSYHRRRPY